MLWILVAFSSILLSVPIESKGIELMEPIRRQRNVSAIACIVELCETYFYPEKQIIGALLVVHIQNVTPFHDTLMKMLMERNIYAINLMNQYSHCVIHSAHCKSTEKAENYFVAFTELEEAIAALHLWSALETWNPLAKFVAVSMNKYERKSLHSQIRLIFEAFFNLHVLNVKVISFRHNSDVIDMHTWYPYEETNCAKGVRNIHLVDECSYSDDRTGPQPVRNIQALQPIIPPDLHGCPLRVASSSYAPFVHYHQARGTYHGIEVRMIQSIAQALGMTPIFIYINETRVNRIVSKETGIYSLLLNRYVYCFIVTSKVMDESNTHSETNWKYEIRRSQESRCADRRTG